MHITIYEQGLDSCTKEVTCDVPSSNKKILIETGRARGSILFHFLHRVVDELTVYWALKKGSLAFTNDRTKSASQLQEAALKG